jgi:hypothetical protein
MIKIFRKIRQRLLSESKFSRYLLYAIGEIILVVVGILFALQINSWNEARVNQLKEHGLLLDLKAEFEYNQTALFRAIGFNKTVVQASIDLTAIIREDKLTEKASTVDSLLVAINEFSSFDGRTGVCDEIINSGKLSLIRNEDLRSRLTNWSGWLFDAREDVYLRQEHVINNLMPFLMKHIPLANGETMKQLQNMAQDSNLFRYPDASPFSISLDATEMMEFENQLWYLKDGTDWIIISDLKTNKYILETLELIENELAKNQP